MELIRVFVAQFFGEESNLALTILLLPFASFAVLFFFANFLPRKGDVIATVSSGISFLLSVIMFINTWGMMVVRKEFLWFVIPTANSIIPFTISIRINDLSSMMLVLVTFVAFLVHLYSLEYMHGKKNYARYFPYLGLFTFSMIGIVLSDNLLLTFMFWELVGFSSYLLIGFWYEKEAAVRAAKKAFLFNRIGDTGFILGLIALFSSGYSFEMSHIQQIVTNGNVSEQLLFWAGLGIFLGCVGKSAQFPLQAWLPDAMEGPTPVSALIHAATMVAAGVYLLVKLHFLLHPDVLTIIAIIGAITAFMGALPALFQNDIKKVLAFSTISQLGFMMIAVGTGAFNAAFFHLITHGFFKACLFLSAGSIIHAMHEVKHSLFVKGHYRDFDSQDMRLMGGFKKVMPVTFVTYIISAASLAGLPFFSGFLSKDAILEGAVHWAAAHSSVFYIIPALAFISIFITAAYMTRQVIMVFMGGNRIVNFYPQSQPIFASLTDPSLLMKGPLIVLAFCSFWFLFSLNPFSSANGWFFRIEGHLGIAIASIAVTLAGVATGIFIFRNFSVSFKDHVPSTKGILDTVKNNWNLDGVFYYLLVLPGIKMAEAASWADRKVVDRTIHAIAVIHVILAHVIAWIDKVLVDGAVNMTSTVANRVGGAARALQSGKIQLYYVFALAAMLILAVWIIIT